MRREQDKARALLEPVKLYLFDLDGTLYLGNRLFEGIPELLSNIRNTGRNWRFLTNNSSKSAASYVEKLTRLGVSCTEEDFCTSAMATAEYLRETMPSKRLFVVGTRSLKAELEKNGLTVCDDPEEAEAAVVGFDTELTFSKMDDLCRLLSTKDVPYIATHPDLTCPTEYGSVPDCGSFCAAVYEATGKKPVVIGKPYPRLAQMAFAKTGLHPSQVAVVGDRLYTDILCGKKAGCVSVLVLTGETKRENLLDCENLPDVVLERATNLNDCL